MYYSLKIHNYKKLYLLLIFLLPYFGWACVVLRFKKGKCSPEWTNNSETNNVEKGLTRNCFGICPKAGCFYSDELLLAVDLGYTFVNDKM